MLEKYKSDIYTCHRCGLCRSKYSDEVRYVCPIREHTGGFEHSFARGRLQIAKGILENRISYSAPLVEEIYKCLLCGSCREMCGKKDPATGEWILDQVAIFKAMRADIVDLGLAPVAPTAVVPIVEKNHESDQARRINRLKWAEGMAIPAKAKTIFFVGCTSSFLSREIAISTTKILKGADFDFGILGNEWCCGSRYLEAGYYKVAEKMARHNIDALKKAGAKTVVTQCAECYKAFKMEYPEIMGDLPFEVLHITQLLDILIKKGKIRLTLTDLKEERVTYHDPCALGRYSGVFDEPRQVINMIPGIEFVEMYPKKQYSWCCGGNIKTTYPELATKIAFDRIKHAQEIDAKLMVTTCPRCKINIQDSVKNTNSNLKICDMTELVAKSMGI